MARLFFGSDHAGVELRKALVVAATELGHEIGCEYGPDDAKTSVDYPDIAHEVGSAVLREPGSFGVLVCGTGQGVAMAANRMHGIRAGAVSDTYSAKMIRAHNDANVVCIGAVSSAPAWPASCSRRSWAPRSWVVVTAPAWPRSTRWRRSRRSRGAPW